ncbi:MAG: hypothetical protein ABIR46_01615 [Candidatus Saccharimonadales bacterium]
MFEDRAHKRFKIITILTAIINVGVVLFMLALGGYGKASGVSGLEFVALMAMPVVFVGYAFALFYLLYFPYYVIKYRQKNTYTFLGVAIFVLVLISLSLYAYSANKSDIQKASANRTMTTTEAEALLNTCNVKSVDEGTLRFQTSVGDVTYMRLKSPIVNEGNTLERYASYQDFETIKTLAEQLVAKCGVIETYTFEETKLEKNKSFEYAR